MVSKKKFTTTIFLKGKKSLNKSNIPISEIKSWIQTIAAVFAIAGAIFALIKHLKMIKVFKTKLTNWRLL